jgi:MFS family permease
LEYYAAKFLAQVAQNLLLAALLIAASRSGGAALGLSGVFAAMLVPAILFGMLGGAIVDRIGPARGLLLGAALRCAVVTGAIALAWHGEWAYAAAFAYSLVSQLFSPSEMALVRTVGGKGAGRTHAFLVALQYGGQGFGMLVCAPALYFAGGLGLMLAGSAVVFAMVVGLAAVIAVRLRETPAGSTLPAREAFTFRETCRFFAGEARARYAVVALAAKVVVARGIVVTLPFYLQHDLGLGREALVFLFLPGIAGAAGGLWWAGRTLDLERAQATMRLAVIGMIVSVFALAALDYGLNAVAQYSQVPPIARLEASMNTTFVVAVPVALLLGLSLSGALVSARVALTATAPEEQQARVFATQATVTDALLVLPLLLTGLGTEFAGARVTLAAIGLVTLLALAALELPGRARGALRVGELSPVAIPIEP